MRVAILAALALAATASQATAAPQTNLADIEDEVMCPICGTTLELSDSPQAEREREFIRGQIAEGSSKQEVKDALVGEYGEDVLALPDSEGFDLVAWVVPAVAILLGVIGVGAAIARLAGRRGGGGSGGDELSAADATRLERDISSYDL